MQQSEEISEKILQVVSRLEEALTFDKDQYAQPE